MNSKRLVFVLAVALTTLAAGHVHTQTQGPSLVVFGTSLSDPGNAFALAGGTNTPPDYSVDPLLVPDRPYSAGGHHFSNGATWVEQFARPLGLSGAAAPALRSSSAVAMNFAVGGARARPGTNSVDLGTQIGAYLQKVGGQASPGSLYIIEMGGNDVRDALVTAGAGGNPFAVLEQAAGAIAGGVANLHNAGARQFLVWSSPDIGLTPAIRGLDQVIPGTAAAAMGLTVYFNAALHNALAQLAPLPDLQIRRLDAFGLIHAIANAPQLFGVTDATTACITPSSAPFHCQSPDEYLFWDGIHPTHVGHGILADEARVVLAP
jgi:phospholipase/lecithinase/hemolysin